jgi:hypothetical protein
MKNWFSTELFKFRWSKMTSGQHYKFIAGTLMMLLSTILLCVSVTTPVEDQYGLNDYVGKYVFILLSFLAFVWSVPFTTSTMEAEGRINQKYIKEMNEIRIKLGRKILEDI